MNTIARNLTVDNSTQRRTQSMDAAADFEQAGAGQRIMSELRGVVKELEAEAICRKLVARHNGRISGESQREHGSVSTFGPDRSLKK
jgi:hypothetical protein